MLYCVVTSVLKGGCYEICKGNPLCGVFFFPGKMLRWWMMFAPRRTGFKFHSQVPRFATEFW